MHLYKRKNGIYYIHFKENYDKWKLLSTKAKKLSDANNFFIEFVKKYSPKNIPDRNTSFDTFSKRYLDYSKVNHSPSNTTRINYVINNLKNYIDSILLSDVNNVVIEAYKKKRMNECKPTTVNIELRALKSMFNTAVEWNLIDRNPLRGVQMMRVPKTYPKFLSGEEVRLLCNTTNFEWLKNIILFAFNTGMRRNEIINLKWEDINLMEKYLIVRNNDTFSTKSKKDRIIPLSITVIGLLSTLSKVSEYVFVNRMKLQLYPNYVTQCFRDLVKECGLKKGISFHTLRHSFASMLVSKGVSLYIVKELLGHSDFAITQIYAHLQKDTLKNAIKLLD